MSDSRYSEIARAVKSGTRADPLSMDEGQRRQATRAAIREDMAAEAS